MKTAARILLIAITLAAPGFSYAAPNPSPRTHDSPSDKVQKKFMKQKKKEEKKMRKQQKKSAKAWKKRNHSGH
jgi:hypothetical protein